VKNNIEIVVKRKRKILGKNIVENIEIFWKKKKIYIYIDR